MIRLQNAVTGEVFGLNELLETHSARIRHNNREYTALSYDPMGYYLIVNQDGTLDNCPRDGAVIEEDKFRVLDPAVSPWLTPKLSGRSRENIIANQLFF